MQKKLHIVVVGSGLAGLTAMVALAGIAERITLLERCSDHDTAGKQDERPISLSYSSVLFFKNAGLWEALLPSASPIYEIHVSEQGCFGSLTLRASDANLDALGYVIPFYVLHNALCEAAMNAHHVERIAVTDIVAIHETEGVAVTFKTDEGEQTLEADKLIAADGAQSRCRQLLNMTAIESRHDDVALTAVLTLQKPHQHVAYQRFTKQGVWALLPMWEPCQYRLVWTLDQMYHAALTDEALLSAVETVWGSRLGVISNLKRMDSYPLSTQLAQKVATQHSVLIGDSAHRLYPLAAQGYNLTVRDCAQLRDVLAQGCPFEEYACARRADQRFISFFTQGLEWIFGLQLPGWGFLRAGALLKMNSLPALKKELILRILGRKTRQPEWLCEE